MLCVITFAVYSVTSLLLFLYIGRIQARHPPISVWLRLASILYSVFLFSLLYFTDFCSLDVWGALLFSLWLSAACVDPCLTERRGRRGTILTVGDLAGCVQEDITRRQFVAPFEFFGRLKKGQRVSFEVFWDKSHGVHTVDGITYKRYESRPLR